MNPYAVLARAWVGPKGHAEDLDPLQGHRWNQFLVRHPDAGPRWRGMQPAPLSVATLHELAAGALTASERAACGAALDAALDDQGLRSMPDLVRRLGAPRPDDLELAGFASVNPPCTLVGPLGGWRLEKGRLEGAGWSEACLESTELFPGGHPVPLAPGVLWIYRTRAMRPDWTDLVGVASAPAALTVC